MFLMIVKVGTVDESGESENDQRFRSLSGIDKVLGTYEQMKGTLRERCFRCRNIKKA